jgi:hypothetical protein
VQRLTALARGSGADLVRAAEIREQKALLDGLLAELDEQQGALVRPQAESEARIETLRQAMADAERALEELGPRMTAVQEQLARAFTEARDAFFRSALPTAEAALQATLDGAPASGRGLRARATETAIEVAQTWLDRGRLEQEPYAERLYREGMQRFLALLGEIGDRMAAVAGQGLEPRPDVAAGVTARSSLFYTKMLVVAPSSAGTRWLDLVRTAAARRRAVEREATAYLARLLEVNSARIKNDFVERVRESRRRLEDELRRRLRDLAASAERAMGQARQARAAGAGAVQARVDAIARLRTEAETLRREA